MSWRQWRWWCCLECRQERYTVAWWADRYECGHGESIGSNSVPIKLSGHPILQLPASVIEHALEVSNQ